MVLTAIKLIHTLAWFSIESCMAYVLWAGFMRRSTAAPLSLPPSSPARRWCSPQTGSGCPLTQIAERVGAEHGAVTDIYLPRWFARNLPAIHVPLIVLAGYLHTRNLGEVDDTALSVSSRP